MFAGLSVFLWTLYLMINPLKFALGAVLFLITVVVGEMLLSEKEDQLDTGSHGKLSGSAHRISGKLVIVAAFVLSLAIIFFVPAIRGEFYVEWSALELPNVARLIAAFGLNFFPGYLILAIVGKPELGKLPKLVTSYLLSLFVLAITGFVSAYVIGVVDEFFLHAFLFVCAVLLAIYLLKGLLHKKSRLDNPKNFFSYSAGFRKILPTLLVGLAVAFMGIWLWWMYSSIGFFIGSSGSDMWRHHSIAQTFLDYQAFRWLHGPWWFGLYLACFTVVSGAPSVNAYMTLYPLIVMPVLSFHVMASSFLSNKKIASLATLSYAIFSGPAWIYALYLRDFAPIVDYDDWVHIIGETGNKFLQQGRYPPFVVGFTASIVAYVALWWVMYATRRLNLQHKFNFFLSTIVAALCYLFHGVDPVIFLIYLSAFLVVSLCIQSNEDKKRVRLAAFSMIAALAMISVIDLSLTCQYDYFNSISPLWSLSTRYFYFNSPSFYALASLSVLIIALTHRKFTENKLMQFFRLTHKKLASKYTRSVKRRLAEMMFYLYGLSLIVFVIFLPSLTVATTGWGWVPWYVYPVIGGIPFFLGLVGATIVLLKWKGLKARVRNTLAFCTLSIVLLFIFGQAISFINEVFFFTRFWERRTLVYIYPMASMLMAYAIVAIFSRVRLKESLSVRYLAKIGVVSLLTSLIVLSSVSSTLIAADYVSRVWFSIKPTTKEELEALRYLHYSLPQGFKTAYLNQRTGIHCIRAFASDKWTEDPYLWLGQYSFYPSSVISAIRNSDAKFLYLNRIRDSQDLEKNVFIQQLIRVLPVEFNNSEVTIYSIPPLRTPSVYSPLGLISPEEREGALYDAYTLWFLALMMSESSYMVIKNASDPSVLNASEAIIMPYDPLGVEEALLLEWVSRGGHLIVSNTNPYGIFAESFGLRSRVSLASCDSTENWEVLAKRGEIFVETNLKIEGTASLRLQNNQSSWERWRYTPSTPWNLSGCEYLGIWVYGTGGGPIWYLHLTDSNGNTNYYRYDLSVFDSETRTYVPSFTGWKLHLIPIREHYGGLDLSTIMELDVNTGSQLPVNILIDEIFVLKERSEKRDTVFADGIAGTENIELPGIKVETLSPSKDVRLIANYTENDLPTAPLAIQKDYGSGKVTYLNANLLYQSILAESSAFTSPHEVLIKILEIIGVEGLYKPVST